MPVTHLLTPDGKPLTFDEAPDWYDSRGLMPRAAVLRVIADLDSEPSTHVRPSDVVPRMNCRRQRVFEASRDYGVNPIVEWSKHEGTAIHNYLHTDEIEVPANGERSEVCGVPMRGRIDCIEGGCIVDIKTKSPYYIVRYGPKGSGIKPWAEPWWPDDDQQIEDYRCQLSIYGVLYNRTHSDKVTRGRVHVIVRGAKADKRPFFTLEFPLLTEEELETVAGPWMRELAAALAAGDPAAVKADGREMVGSKGNLWACDRCFFRRECDAMDEGKWATF